MTIDFSDVNLQYLIQARDLSKEDPELAAVLMGVEPGFTELFARVTPAQLAPFGRVRVPLIKPHQQLWWWSRFAHALKSGESGAMDALLEQANLMVIQCRQKESEHEANVSE